MKLSKGDIMFFSQPGTLFCPLLLFCIYTGPTVLVLIRVLLDGSLIELLKEGGWLFFLWGEEPPFSRYTLSRSTFKRNV